MFGAFMSRATRLFVPSTFDFQSRAMLVSNYWGALLDVYIKNWQPSTPSTHSITVVKSAIETFALNRAGTVSESTLEALLSVIHYPELFEQHLSERFLEVWFDLLAQYQKHHAVSFCP